MRSALCMHLQEHLNSSNEFIKWFHLNWSLCILRLNIALYLVRWVCHIVDLVCVTVRLFPLSFHRLWKCSTGSDYANLIRATIAKGEQSGRKTEIVCDWIGKQARFQLVKYNLKICIVFQTIQFILAEMYISTLYTKLINPRVVSTIVFLLFILSLLNYRMGQFGNLQNEI